uniref:Uncharacterized protein n=1 Tax=Megaselia scalaris TaxID=36166 RepID=T1GF54_MEGSC
MKFSISFDLIEKRLQLVFSLVSAGCCAQEEFRRQIQFLTPPPPPQPLTGVFRCSGIMEAKILSTESWLMSG